ncbi:O-antigen ligase family protein [Neobacillus sp. PS3-12]|uniref:O-antigen ligase family protein n=1 Tax=Neobacillus sp. PS3-12 TaxID=3070677 RepID=UPI0027DEF37D|nr:O-antigen ligase family protein [Neobacillus sp. PS3-12]WML55185.1 O-antigen ligase family protein [Neobacillus sp. PS3-12]
MNIFQSKVFKIICLIGVIYDSGYALSTVYIKLGFYIEAALAYLFMFPIVKLLYKKRLNIPSSAFLLLILMLVSTFITTGMTGYKTYLTFIFKIIIAFGIVIVYKFDDFVKVYLKIMVLVSVFSLIGYFMTNSGNMLFNFPTVENANSVLYGVGYIFFYIPIVSARNCGIFWEPGLFATFLIIAMIFELFYKKNKPSILKIILFVICLITTNSSAGYGLLLFVFCLIAVNKACSIRNKYIRTALSLLTIFLSIICITNYSNIFELIGLADNPIVAKLFGDQLKDQSRVLAINYNISMFLKEPIFGVGFIEAFRNVKYVADTSTSTFLLSVFGIFGIQYTFYWVVGIINSKNNHWLVNTMIAIVFLLIINTEPHYMILTSWCIIFYFLQSTVKKKFSTSK